MEAAVSVFSLLRESKKSPTVRAVLSVKNRYEHQRGFSWLFLYTRALPSIERKQKEPSSETNTRTPPPQTATAAPVCPSPYCALEQSLWYWEESGSKINQKKRPKSRLLSYNQLPISALVPALSLRSGRTLCTSYGKLPLLKAERERQGCWAEGISLPDIPAAAPPSRGVPETQRGPSPG